MNWLDGLEGPNRLEGSEGPLNWMEGLEGPLNNWLEGLDGLEGPMNWLEGLEGWEGLECFGHD